MSIALPPPRIIYTSPANLWVEDPITRDYLQELWQDPDIGIQIAGGLQIVRGVTREAEVQGLTNVFGLIDRDFGVSNHDKWGNPKSGARIFVPTVHEIENFMLDHDALAGGELNTQRRSITEIEGRMHHDAKLWVWQIAASKVIAVWRDTFQSDFPDHPNRTIVHDQPSALDYLRKVPWYADLPKRAQLVTLPTDPDDALSAAHLEVQLWLTDGRWLSHFPGKELFRDIRGFVYTPPPGPSARGVQPDSDLAKSVARWQRANHCIPVELDELRIAIRIKAGI